MQVNIFLHRSFKGDLVSVFVDVEHLSIKKMQNIIRRTKSSDTSWVWTNDKRLQLWDSNTLCNQRINFAGIQTLSTCRELLERSSFKENQIKSVMKMSKHCLLKTKSNMLCYFRFLWLPCRHDVDSKFLKEHVPGVFSS